MSRVPLLVPLAASLSACPAPALENWTTYDPPPKEQSSSTTDTDTDTDTTWDPIMTSTSGSGSGANSSTDDPAGTSSSTGPSTTAETTTSTSTTTTTSGGDSICGDGLVTGDEECDDANDDDLDRCANDCTKNRWVFASAASDHNGAMGGIEGLDSRCRQYALQSGHADDSWTTFIAWVSDSTHDVRDRLYPGKGRYLRTDGQIVVEHVQYLYSGTLLAPIDVDEHGLPASGSVLTGTKPDGTAAPGTHCDNWTTGELFDFSLYVGNTGFSDAGWTMDQDPDINPQGCAGKAWRLYCIEGA